MQRIHPAAALLLGLVAVPLLWSLGQAGWVAWDAEAWHALWLERQTLSALGLSLWTGLASAALATLACAWLLSRTATLTQQQRLQRHQTWLLAVPHAAFAMGLVLLIAPSGWLLRLLSPWATGLAAPPPWPTTQDPWGLGLIAVLTLKEIPFLLWSASSHLLRPEVAQRLQRELQLASTLGYAQQAAWWRIVWPQLLPRLAAPLLAVLAYSLTVVDVALVIGPASPPTLAVLCWQWLQDADVVQNAKGGAAAWALAGLVLLCAAVAWALLHAAVWRRWRSSGVPPQTQTQTAQRTAKSLAGPSPQWPLMLLAGIYGAVLLALLLGSFIGSWPFPQLLPARWSMAAWATVWDSTGTVWTTLWLAAGSAACALLWVVAWLELAPAPWHARMQTLAYAPLVLPGLLWAIGLHRLALAWGLDGSASGVWLAHTLACLPYVLLSTVGAYSGFDTRWWQLAASLGQTRWQFVLRVKWPLLRASLAAGFAVGFAVSVAQYLPTLYIGAGRLATVTTEAVGLAAGGQRKLMAAFAWLQWLLPVLVYMVAARLGRGRRFGRPPGAPTPPSSPPSHRPPSQASRLGTIQP
ncbi:ABC transporter permease [Rhodoferax lacus]|uniref:ABC transporter permease n=1 Tax=Rhodoferax lacus TaxID=2184758 RepID=UPI0018F318C9|nr:ABC transporter permease [Rhodoferax lacus]